jgi:exodeoxyribonuclease V alpha subunit
MSHLRYEGLPPRLPADLAARPEERALARALARWVLAHGGSASLSELAARTVLVEQGGHTALLMDDAPERARVASESLVGDGTTQTPFVLDADGRFYLWRNFAHEGEVAARVAALRAAATPLPMAPAELAALFPDGDPARDGAQRAAVDAVGGRRLFLLTGGPGTGKTTTVLRMLLRLLRDGIAARDGIAIAAPTGKAAQRLVQSVRQEAMRLREALPDDWAPYFDALGSGEALTVHRLLGWSPRRHAFQRGPESPIDAGIVVVDEASMLDLAQLRALLRALRPGATLVLVGDADQLDSVGAGAVLGDIVAVLEAEGAADLVRLRHSFRADTRLLPVNEAVRNGDAAALDTALSAAGDQAHVRAVEDTATLARVLRRWADTLADDAPPAPLPADELAPGAALDALRRLAGRQLLCALREGAFGAIALNEAIERRLRQRWSVPADASWFPGRVVMVTRNDYGSGLFNGDVGLCLRGADGELRVWFEAAEGGARSFAPGALPAHAPAWALTIHKSQGSEYGEVAVLLPPDPDHRILSRQLLYTALSRARHSVEIWGPRASLENALAKRIERAGGLVSRLYGMTPG